MAIKLNTVKCPECGAELPVEEGRTQIFCSYCGSRVIITNENEHIYRHIDEAEIKHEETERIVKLWELELEEKEHAFEKKKLIIIVSSIAGLLLIGILGMTFHNSGMSMCLLFAMIMGGAYLYPLFKETGK